jgi:hypothetical protein
MIFPLPSSRSAAGIPLSRWPLPSSSSLSSSPLTNIQYPIGSLTSRQVGLAFQTLSNVR